MKTQKKRITINDIARLAGVSQTAVSFVLNGKNGVSAATREKVNSVIQATAFQPNASSRRLSFKRSFNIALVYPSSASPFTDLYYYEITRGLTEHLSDKDYNVVFTHLKTEGVSDMLPRILLQHDADGAILLQDMPERFLSQLDETDIPYVLVDIHTPDRTHTHVSVDSECSIHAAVHHLIQCGHTRIAFLGSDWLPSYYLQCLTGYQRALEENGLPLQPAWIQKGANDRTGTERCVDHLLDCVERPTAICCSGDIHAIEAIRAVRNRGLSVPEDMSFISIDDILLSQYIEPALTTVGFEKSGMGCLAADLLLNKIAGKPVESVILKTDIIVERNSVRRLI